APLEEGVEEPGVGGGVGALGAGVVGGRLGAEEEPDERGLLGDDGGDAGVGQGRSQPGGQPGGGGGELLVGGGGEQLERGEPRRGGERVPRQGAGLVDGPERRHLAHDVAAAAVGADVEAAADHLAEGGEVGPHAGALLGPAAGDPEAGDDLVEDEERADPVALGPQPLEEPGGGRDEAHVGGDRLDDDAGHGVVEVGHDVVGDDAGVLHGGGGDAGGAGQPEGGEAAAGLGEEQVAVAVVVAGELHDDVAAGEAAGDADRGHRGL